MKKLYTIVSLSILLGLSLVSADYFTWDVVGSSGIGANASDQQDLEISGTNLMLASSFSILTKVLNIYNGMMVYDENMSWNSEQTFNNDSKDMKMNLDYLGTPYIIFADVDTNLEATVIKRNGITRDMVGAAGFSRDTYEAVYPDLRILDNGNILAVFQEYTDKQLTSLESRLYHYDLSKNSWSNITSIGAESTHTDIEADSKGKNFIAYVENNLIDITEVVIGKDITLSQYATDISQGQATGLDFEIASNDQFYLAYLDSLAQELKVLTFSGSSWVSMGNFVASGYVGDLDLRIDSENNPYIAYIGDADGVRVKLKKRENNQRNDMGTVGTGTLSTGYTEPSVSLAFNENNEVYVAYRDGVVAGKSTVKKIREVITCFSALYSQDYTASSCIGVPDAGITRASDAAVIAPDAIVPGISYIFQLALKNLSTTEVADITEVKTRLGTFHLSGPVDPKATEQFTQLKGKVFKKDAFLNVLEDL